MTNEAKFFRSLVAPDTDALCQLGVNRTAIEQCAQAFCFRTRSDDVVRLDLRYFHTSNESWPNLVFYGRFVGARGELLAIWASTFFIDAKRERGSEIVVVERRLGLSTLQGFGRAFIAFYNTFNRLFNADYEIIRANWLGRKVWTALGQFQFDDRYTFLANGEPCTQRDLVLQNFSPLLCISCDLTPHAHLSI
ncbi:MAG: hypothetical protein HYV02_05080 [Deltaproteobacteria bacterium]|nr:hypothetical protein [Deltaproteobacteria bacterium]